MGSKRNFYYDLSLNPLYSMSHQNWFTNLYHQNCFEGFDFDGTCCKRLILQCMSCLKWVLISMGQAVGLSIAWQRSSSWWVEAGYWWYSLQKQFSAWSTSQRDVDFQANFQSTADTIPWMIETWSIRAQHFGWLDMKKKLARGLTPFFPFKKACCHFFNFRSFSLQVSEEVWSLSKDHLRIVVLFYWPSKDTKHIIRGWMRPTEWWKTEP